MADGDRWTGGDGSYEHEMASSGRKEGEKEVRGSGDAKRSTRRDVSYVSEFHVGEGTKSGGMVESMRHRSERKEKGEKESGSERQTRGSRGDRSERLVDIVSVSASAGSDGNMKQSGSGEERGGKHGVGNTDDRRFFSREEIAKSGKHKDDVHHDHGHEDKINRDVIQEDIPKNIWRQDEKKRDYHSMRDYSGGKSDDNKHSRNNKNDLDVSYKVTKPRGGEYDRELDRDRERYRDHAHKFRDSYDDKLKRLDGQVDNGRSLLCKHNVDSVTSSSWRTASLSSRLYAGAEKFRAGVQDETKYGDSLTDRTVPEAFEKAPKYGSGVKRVKFDDNLSEDFPGRSPNTKVSPSGVKESSPSSTSFDRIRFSRRNARRNSLDVVDAERICSGSFDTRNVGMTEDRQRRNLPTKHSLEDEYPPSESSLYHKSGQANVSSPSPASGSSVFRTRVDSRSFVGSFGEDIRGSGSRYRRSVDPNVGRDPGDAWNGIPNWSSPFRNGVMPFSPGPSRLQHGGFPPIISHFSPFGFGPNFDMNQQGLPYNLGDGNRFLGHVRPVGWSDMVEGPFSHIHGWDAGSSILRNDSSTYRPGHHDPRRDMNLGNWKQNSELNMDVISGYQRDGPTMNAYTDEASSALGVSKPNVESSCLDDQAACFKDASSDLSPMKEIPLASAKGTNDKTPESFCIDDTTESMRAYLIKVDVSMDLADPELYNQFNLAIKRVCEYIEDCVDLEFMEDKADMESEITNLTVDMKILPTAKESIFQTAMDLSNCIIIGGHLTRTFKKNALLLSLLCPRSCSTMKHLTQLRMIVMIKTFQCKYAGLILMVRPRS